MDKVKEILKGTFFLATCEGDQPRVRAFDACVFHNEKFYFQTVNTKKVYQQMIANPKIEMYAMSEIYGILRLTAEVELVKGAELVEKVSSEIGRYLDNPDLAVFSLRSAEIHLTDKFGKEEIFRI